MRRFLTISEGEDAATASTILATCDSAIIDLVARAIARRLGCAPPSPLAEVHRRKVEAPEDGGRE